MIVRFDSLNRFEQPKFYLCNPGSVYDDKGCITKMVGILSDTEDEEIVFNFNMTSELNFRVYKPSAKDGSISAYNLDLYKKLENRRMIFVDDIGYFVITSITNGYSDEQFYKDIHAESCEVEIENITVPYFENGTYKFYDDMDTEDSGIINIIARALPLWTVDVDSIPDGIKDKYRTFEDIAEDTNCLGFLLDDVQNAYECIFKFDCINRVISVFDQADFAKDTNILLTKDDVIDSIDISEDSEDLYTAISVRGGDNISINKVNPLGISTIYNFDHYIDWMSSELQVEIQAWKDSVAQIELDMGTKDDTAKEYYAKSEELERWKLDKMPLDYLWSTYTNCNDQVAISSYRNSYTDSYNELIESYFKQLKIDVEHEFGIELEDTKLTTEISEDGTPETIKKEKEALRTEIERKLKQLGDLRGEYNDKIETLTTEVAQLSSDLNSQYSSLKLEKRLSPELYEELSNYIFEGIYTDEYIIITDAMDDDEKYNQIKTLYDRAKKQLEKISTPKREFSIDVENFIFSKAFEHWSKELETGCVVNVEVDDGEVDPLMLISITVNYADKTLSLGFGNKLDRADPKALFEDALGEIKKSSNSINYIKEIITPVKSGEIDKTKEALSALRNLSMNAALASTNQEVVIDSAGYTGKKLSSNDDSGYDQRQVKLTANQLVFTKDAWDTCDVAIGEIAVGKDGSSIYGINASMIIGDIMLGEELHLLGEDGKDYLTATNESIKTIIGDLGEYGEVDEEGVVTKEGTGIKGSVTTLEQNSKEFNIKIQDLERYGTKEVTTTNQYTFNSKGLTISDSKSDIKNLVNHEGMFVKRVEDGTETTVLQADFNGVEALNLSARKYLIAGSHCRFEDYVDRNNENKNTRTACYYVDITYSADGSYSG